MNVKKFLTTLGMAGGLFAISAASASAVQVVSFQAFNNLTSNATFMQGNVGDQGGNFLIVAALNNTDAHISNVAYGINNFTHAANSSVLSFSGRAMDVWFISSASAGQQTVTVSFDRPVTNAGFYFWSLSGFDPTTVGVDGVGTITDGTPDASHNASGSSITTSVPNGFVVASIMAGSTITADPAAGNEFTHANEVGSLNDTSWAGDYVLNSTAGAHQPVWSTLASVFTSATVGFGDHLAGNPAPTITSLSPDTVQAGGPDFTLTINGNNFLPTSTVTWDGAAPFTATYVSANQLTVLVPASATSAAGTHTVTVVNPAPGGGTSSGATFTVTSSGRTLTSLTPSSMPAGTPPFIIQLNGTGFMSGDTVTFGGFALTPSNYVSPTEFTASVDLASLGLGPGNYAVTIGDSLFTNTSNPLTFTVTAPGQGPPTITNPTTYSSSCSLYQGTMVQYFYWNYQSPVPNNESRFELKVSPNANFSNPVVDRTFSNLSNTPGSLNDQTVLIKSTAANDQLVYGATYYWEVQVWDSANQASGWQQGTSFTTPSHIAPYVSFSASPGSSSPGQTVSFTDASVCYDSGNNPVTCQSFNWDFGDGSGTSVFENPTYAYAAAGTYGPTLSVSDAFGKSCSWAIHYSVCNSAGSGPLPSWKEIPFYLFGSHAPNSGSGCP